MASGLMNLYSVRDAKAASFAPPFLQRSDAEASRSFAREVNDNRPNNMLHDYPDDFVLYCIGTFDPDNGQIEPCSDVVCNGNSVALPRSSQIEMPL